MLKSSEIRLKMLPGLHVNSAHAYTAFMKLIVNLGYFLPNYFVPQKPCTILNGAKELLLRLAINC
jgi:hypothetical protein